MGRSRDGRDSGGHGEEVSRGRDEPDGGVVVAVVVTTVVVVVGVTAPTDGLLSPDGMPALVVRQKWGMMVVYRLYRRRGHWRM